MKVDQLFLLGLAGIVLTVSASIVKDIAPEGWRFRKVATVLTVIVGAILAIWSLVEQQKEAVNAKNEKQVMVGQLQALGIEVNGQSGSLERVHQDVGQANDLVPGKYSVLLAADSTSAGLVPYAKNLHKRFPGIDKGQICIAQSPDANAQLTRYRLYFGHNVNFTTAALFLTLATNSGFQPANQHAGVVDDLNSQCVPFD